LSRTSRLKTASFCILTGERGLWEVTRSPFAATCHDRIAPPVLLCGHMCIVKLHFVKFSRKFGQILSKFDQIWSNFENLGKFEAFWKFVKSWIFVDFEICGQILVKIVQI